MVVPLPGGHTMFETLFSYPAVLRRHQAPVRTANYVATIRLQAHPGAGFHSARHIIGLAT